MANGQGQARPITGKLLLLLAVMAGSLLLFLWPKKPASGPAPRPEPEPVGPTPEPPPGAPPGVSPEAQTIPYKRYTIYVWEARDAQENFLQWTWIVSENGLVAQSGSSKLAGLTGEAAAEFAAKAWVDAQPGGGFTPISPEADRTDYKSHAIYVWEMENPGAAAGDPMGWHWVAQVGPITGVTVAEGHVTTPDLTGVEEALAAAKAWVDAEAGFTPISPDAERTDYKGHAIYVWKMPPNITPGWHWVAQVGPVTGVSVAEGHATTADEALAAAKAWVDAEGGSGGGGNGTATGGGGAGGFGGG